MEEQEISSRQDIYIDSSIPIPKEIPENRGTRIFVNLVFGLNAVISILAGFSFTVIILILVSLSWWQPFIMVQAPSLVVVGILAPFISIYSLYLFFKVRTMSQKGWLFGLTVFFDSITFYIGEILFIRGMSRAAIKLTGEKSDNIPSNLPLFGFSPLTHFAVIVVYILIILGWIMLRRGFNNTNSRVSKKAKYVLAGYTIFLVVVIIAIYTPFIMATQERPFIGYKKATKDLGKEPVLFNIPEGYTFSTSYSVKHKEGDSGLVLMYVGERGKDDKINMILITENTHKEVPTKDAKETIDILGQKASYLESSPSAETKRRGIVMEREGLSIIVAATNTQAISKQALIDIAKTAK